MNILKNSNLTWNENEWKYKKKKKKKWRLPNKTIIWRKTERLNA
jgi:hypothetical protein